jgi:hypothetical protein
MQLFRKICDAGQGEYTGVGGLDLPVRRDFRQLRLALRSKKVELRCRSGILTSARNSLKRLTPVQSLRHSKASIGRQISIQHLRQHLSVGDGCVPPHENRRNYGKAASY